MNRLGILLIHGFSGSADDFAPLGTCLEREFGETAVEVMTLPGHARGEQITRFDRETLQAAIASRLASLRHAVDTLIVLGHSTGGTLLVATLEECGTVPDLVILAATPGKVDLSYLERWQNHAQQRNELSLTTVSGLVKAISAVAASSYQPPCPVLLVQGGRDRLVLPTDLDWWQHKLSGQVEQAVFTGSGHHLFNDCAQDAVTAFLVNRIKACLDKGAAALNGFVRALVDAEPEAKDFIDPDRAFNLAQSPSGRRLQEVEPQLPDSVPWDPVIANIEITTSCNLSCRYCARSRLQPAEKMMAPELFTHVLDQLPNTYRLTLVGLGEPLLHPQLTDFIRLAKSRHHRVGLVTNAQLLNEAVSSELLDAGLDSIAFSLDTADENRLAELRPGSALETIEMNIRAFCRLARSKSRPVSTAVFTAVSASSLAGLENLIDKVSRFGVHVLMLSDLNFIDNREDSLSSRIDPEMERAVRRAVSHGFSNKLPILGVRHLEDFGQAKHYRKALLMPPHQLYRRSKQHRHCVSPWQTLSINVAGDICICDCQPERTAGNLQRQSLDSIWNSPAMQEQRQQMRSQQPPAECLACPRF